MLILISGTCFSQGVFPDIPAKILPAIDKIPDRPGLIIEVKTVPIYGDPVWTADKKGFPIEITVSDLADGNESRWSLAPEIPSYLMNCGICENLASWSDASRQLLLAFHDQIFLVKPDGSYSLQRLNMPGHLAPYEGTSNFAISSDGKKLAYSLSARDKADTSVDPTDINAAKFGRRYEGLYVQDINGSMPRRIAGGETVYLGGYKYVPALSPTGQKIAYVRNFSHMVIAEESGVELASMNLPAEETGEYQQPYITEIRWSPNAQLIGVIVKQYPKDSAKGRPIERLHVVDSSSLRMRRVMYADFPNASISAFAWSPDSAEIVFRSDTGMKEVCSFNFFFRIQAGKLPCRVGYHLFRGNIDGSRVRKISKVPEFMKGQLFWIQ